MDAERIALDVVLALCVVSGICTVLLYLVTAGAARFNESLVAAEQRANSRTQRGAK